MKHLLIFLLLLLPLTLLAQDCVYINQVTVNKKFKELNSRNIKFGIKQIAEEILSEKHCLADSSNAVNVEVYSIGAPKTTIRIIGASSISQVTQVNLKVTYKGIVYEGLGEAQTDVRSMFIELENNEVPFNNTTISTALKRALQSAIQQIP
jgi:hypothetical protein